MTRATGGVGLRPAPKHLLPQKCSWQTSKCLPAEETGIKNELLDRVDYDVGPPCGKNAYWIMGYLFEARFYCKKHGQIIWKRHHRYSKIHGNKRKVSNAIHSKEKGKQVRSGKHTDQQSQGNPHNQSSSGKAKKATGGNQARVATN